MLERDQAPPNYRTPAYSYAYKYAVVDGLRRLAIAEGRSSRQ